MTNLEKTIRIEAEGVISSITFRHDGKHILGGSALGTLSKWGIDGREIGLPMSMCSEVGTVAASKNGLWIVCGISTGSAIIWDGSTHAKVVEVEPTHTDWVLSIDISPDSMTFATGSYDMTAILWDILTAQKLLGPLRHPAHVCAVRFSPNGERLATATWGDLSIRIFDRYTGDLVTQISNAVNAVRPNPFAWTSDGQRIFASYKGGMKQFNVETTKELSSWSIDPHRVIGSISLANNGQFVACPVERDITLWDTVTHAMVGSPIRYTGRVKSIAISPDDTLLATGQDDDQITLQNLRDVLPPSYFIMPATPASERTQPDANTRSNAVIPLMQISRLGFDSWIHGRLGNAESVFTQEITRSSGNHHALANRAFIRVRSKRWKEAFEDAEESIKIQPSAIGFIAKSIALIGNGKIADGYRSCDLAFAHSNPDDILFLHAIKCIILCMAEDYEQAILHLNGVTRSIVDNIYHSVKAQVYILFGNSRQARHEYDHAVQLFQAAHAPTRAFESPHLTMMSLVFGWDFEDLWINAQRGLCEALCATDRPAEAIEALHEMSHYFDNEVRPSQLTMDWITDFKQRCALTLERNGDHALAINDYKEATIHYTLALQLCRPRPKPNPKTTILKKWVKAKLTSNSSWTEALSASVEFEVQRLAIYQVLCDFLAEDHRIPEAIECLLSVLKDAKAETVMNEEYHQWVPDFYHRCGDIAMQLKEYNVAIEYYSAAAVLQPQDASTFFKRSQARVAIGRWDDALQDAHEAVQVDPASPMGYEMQYTVFYGTRRYDEAIDAFEKMLSAIEQSKDPEISQLRKRYVPPTKIRSTLLEKAYAILKQSPLVLIDVTSGHLYSETERRDIFERDLAFKELIASMSKEQDEGRMQEAVDKYFGYAMLSHVWTRSKDGDEPKFADLDETKKTVWDLPKTPPCEKLRKFCHEARNMGFKWGWSDTICIDKSKSAILDQSLRSMYKWYERSGATLVFLEGVKHPSKPGDLRDCIWMTRAWTLQELLAPKVVIFYDSEWKHYLDDSNLNHKKSPGIMLELAAAIKLSSETIVEFHPENLKVREKLRLASTRSATIVEDVAYSLIGIFKSDVEPRYGHEHAALGRLLDEIVTRSGDVTVLDWAGKSSLEYNSCLPDSIAVYSQRPFSPGPLGGEAMETSIARLREVLPHHEIVKFYNEVSALPSAKFVARRLSLPSIIFRVGSLAIDHLNPTGENVYTATITGIGTVTFTTIDMLSPREAKKLVLIYPWIQYIRGPLRRTTQEHEAGVDAASPPPAVFDERTALQLIARFKQPFRALFLLKLQHDLYKRVAAEHEIVVEPTITSLTDIRVKTLHVL